MADIVLKDVKKSYTTGVLVIHGVTATIADGEFIVIVGPSGCGKSTLLRMIAGLETITSGEIAIGGRVVNDVEPKDRNIAMVFQNYALYPHMTVYENMSYGLRIRRMPGEEIRKRVENAAKILELGQLLERKPRQLSGGQRQRVAMGRAIVREPAAFLFDEPLSNLDAKLRVQMRLEIQKLHRELRTTSIFVTHDQVEAMTLADRMIVMNAGVAEQVGRPIDVYDDPNSLFVAGFIGSPAMNFLPARLEGDVVKLPFGDAPLPKELVGKLENGKEVIAGMRPEHFEDAAVAADRGIEGMRFSADVAVVESMGSELYAYFDVKGAAHSDHLDALADDAGLSELPGQSGGDATAVVARLDASSPAAAGKSVDLVLDASRLQLFDPNGGRNLTLTDAEKADAPSA